MTDLENKDLRLKDPYQARASPLVKCADVARQQGYPVFAIQDGGRCMSGPAAEESYKQFGISRDCRGILGGAYANSVYKLIGEFATAVSLTTTKPLPGNFRLRSTLFQHIILLAC